jgi:hypothetical protein
MALNIVTVPLGKYADRLNVIKDVTGLAEQEIIELILMLGIIAAEEKLLGLVVEVIQEKLKNIPPQKSDVKVN